MQGIDSTEGTRQVPYLTNRAVHAYIASLLKGEAAGYDFDRLATADIVLAYDVSATGVVLDQPCLAFGMETIAIGTSSTLTLHDNASAASGTIILPAIATGTINVLGYQRSFCAGAAVLCENGLYATVGGTGTPVFRIYAVPVA
jgi:hypothetical protein